MIQASKPIIGNREDRQLHGNSQIANEIIVMYRHHATACSFHDDVFDPTPK
jgi:hypothetical protein